MKNLPIENIKMWSSGEISSCGRKSDSSMKCILEYVKERQKHNGRNIKGKSFEKHFLIILENMVLNYNNFS